MSVGIEALSPYVGQCSLNIRTLFEARKLNLERFDNLLMEEKVMGLPCEDPVTNAVNAAKPIVDALGDEKDKIELLITASESGLDFGKAIGTYVHDYLDLSRHCRIFETKEACYAGTAAIQMAAGMIASGASLEGKALVIATDSARASVKMTYAEPSQGTGAVAMLISDDPQVMEIDIGASGLYSYEVMDTYRPQANVETGDPDLSLMAYIGCLEESFKHYKNQIDGIDFCESFDYLAFHTPFAGLVKSAHRKLMEGHKTRDRQVIDDDFDRRISPSLAYPVRVGNLYSGSLYLALSSLIDKVRPSEPKRIGLFSYGSGCSSEFYSGVITETAGDVIAKLDLSNKLENRYKLNMEEYDRLIELNEEWIFGLQDKKMNFEDFQELYEKTMKGKGLLTLQKIDNYHRIYDWS